MVWTITSNFSVGGPVWNMVTISMFFLKFFLNELFNNEGVFKTATAIMCQLNYKQCKIKSRNLNLHIYSMSNLLDTKLAYDSLDMEHRMS